MKFRGSGGGVKVCINGSGHMAKMATRAINSTNLKKSSSLEPVVRIQRILI